jgi:hypothetical protein
VRVVRSDSLLRQHLKVDPAYPIPKIEKRGLFLPLNLKELEEKQKQEEQK